MSADTDRLVAQARNSAGHLYSAELVALADALEAAEAQRDTLAEALQFIAEVASDDSPIQRAACAALDQVRP